MTLQEAKDQVAKIHYFNTWNEIDWYFMNDRNGITEPPYMEERLQVEAFELYAQSQVNDALDKAIEAAIKLSYSPWGHESFPIIASESLIEELKLLKR